MKQTTNNKSSIGDSCQRGWRLLSIIAAYFTCSFHLKPFLLKYLETNAYDRRRAFHGQYPLARGHARFGFLWPVASWPPAANPAPLYFFTFNVP